MEGGRVNRADEAIECELNWDIASNGNVNDIELRLMNWFAYTKKAEWIWIKVGWRRHWREFDGTLLRYAFEDALFMVVRHESINFIWSIFEVNQILRDHEMNSTFRSK